jgi:hypothetical protein
MARCMTASPYGSGQWRSLSIVRFMMGLSAVSMQPPGIVGRLEVRHVSLGPMETSGLPLRPLRAVVMDV